MKSVPRVNASTIVGDASLLRTETLDGREYLVSPVVALVEGSHNNEYISYDELVSLYADAWAGRPVTIDHAMDAAGHPVTANSPDVFESSRVGFLFNVVAREDIRGIAGEIWIDIEKAATVPGGTRVLEMLRAGEQLEVSTGYFTTVENTSGKFTNSRGEVEEYTGVQRGVRPDHLALLPYDTGACSWEDGCGSPRVNKEKLVSKELKVNGVQLGKALTAAIAAHQGDDGTSAVMITRLATAAGIDEAKVRALINGQIDFAPKSWLEIFAAVLDLDCFDLMYAASNDNADVRYAMNAAEQRDSTVNAEATQEDKSKEKISTDTKDSVTLSDNSNMSESATQIVTNDKTCKPCEMSLRSRVTNFLKSLVTDEMTPEEKAIMNKKEKVDALIANDRTQFVETSREWLMTLSEDQLATLEPKAEAKTEVAAAAATATNVEKAEVKEEAKAETKVEAKVEAKAAQLKAEDVYAAIGLNAEDVALLKTQREQLKLARNEKIEKILASDGCVFEKAELEAFNDKFLDKTLALLQPQDTPFRIGAKQATNAADANSIPAAPSILLAPIGKEVK